MPTTTTITRALAAAAISCGALAASAGVAGADHGHFLIREDRDGTARCRYVAEGQTAKGADDPGGHAFHEHVHTGRPGSDDRGTDVDKSINEEDRCDVVE